MREYPEKPSLISQGLVERRQLARGRAELRRGPELGAIARHALRCCNPRQAQMRKNDGDMEIALEVPQPRLRAVPSEPAPPDDSGTDAELLARVGARDREAFEILYGRYVRPVFGLAL